MGLDQWLYRVQHLTKEEAIALEGKHYNEISKDGSLLLFRANEPEDGSKYEYSKLPIVEIDVTDEECNKYSYEEVEDYYVCKKEKIYYWRKNYELQDKLYEAAEENGDQILNCGWHKCNEETIMDIQDSISQEDNMRSVLNLPESEAYVYHEWY